MIAKLTLHLSRMDCPTEEQLVRMKLASADQIQRLQFDLPSRTLVVYHKGRPEPIITLLQQLNLGASVVAQDFTDDLPAQEPSAGNTQRTVLWQVFAINLGFFLIEILAGALARSVGLIADSLDMMADAIVYGLSLYAVGRPTSTKNRIAKLCGYFQMTLALLGLVEVARRALGFAELPEFKTMIVVSAFALMGNTASLFLLQKARSSEVHMRATMIFTSTDVVANIGVIAAAILVYVTDSKVPDLIVGSAVFALVTLGAIRILRLTGAGSDSEG